MNSVGELQKVLRRVLVQSQATNPAYSLRALSRKLRVSPAALSLLLAGKRKPSRKMIDRIAKGLCMDPFERSRLLSLPKANSKSAPVGEEEFLQLSSDQFHVLSDWHYLGILNLIQTKGFKSEPSYIADRLGITVPKTIAAIECLKRLGMIREGNNKSLERSKSAYRTKDDVQDLAVQKSHQVGIELAAKKLVEVSVDQRDFTWYMGAIDPSKLPEAKQLIRKFQDRLFALLKDGPNRTEVYRLNMQLFPLTKENQK